MLTDRQYERLPQVLKEIVDNDQQRGALLGAMVSDKVVPFAAVQGYAKLNKIRGELRRGASRLWGGNLNKNAAAANRRDDDETDPFPGVTG